MPGGVNIKRPGAGGGTCPNLRRCLSRFGGRVVTYYQTLLDPAPLLVGNTNYRTWKHKLPYLETQTTVLGNTNYRTWKHKLPYLETQITVLGNTKVPITAFTTTITEPLSFFCISSVFLLYFFNNSRGLIFPPAALPAAGAVVATWFYFFVYDKLKKCSRLQL